MTWIGATTGSTDDAAHTYNNPANWANGTIDNSFAGVILTGNTTLYFNANLTTGGSGLNLGYSGDFNLTLESASATTETLTLGGGISGTFGGSTVTIGDPVNNLDIDLGATGQTFNIAAGNTLVIQNVITDTGGLDFTGAGTLTLNGPNNYSGGTTLAAGVLNLNNASALGTGLFTVDGGTIDNTSGAAITLSTNNLEQWNQSFIFNGTNNLNMGAGAVTMGGNIQLTTNAGNFIIDGNIGDGGNGFKLTKSGATGTLTLAGNNTFSGGMTFTSGSTAGQLNIDSATAVGTGIFTINSGTTLDNTSGSAITMTGENSVHWNGSFTFAGTSNLDLGTAGVIMSAAHTVTVNAGTLEIDGVLSGVGFLATKNGNGALTLTGANTYTGGTTLSGGTININNASAIGTGALDITSGTIDNTSGAAITLTTDNTQTWGGNFTFGGTDPLDLGDGAVNLSGQRTITLDGSTLTEDGVVSGGHTLTLNGNGALALTGTNTYTGGTILSAATLDINNASAIGTGKLIIDSGTIDNTSGAAITLSTNNQVSWSGNFTFGGSNPLNLGIGAVTLTGNRTVTVDGSVLTVGGVISGAGDSVTESGTGALALAGTNTFSGGVTLSSGTLDINNAAAIGTGTFTIDGGTIDNTTAGAITLSNNNAQTWGGNFTYGGTRALNLGTGAVTLGGNETVTLDGNTLTVNGVISGTGDGLSEAGAGALVLGGDNSYSGGTTLTAGTLDINTAAAIGTGTFTIDGGTIDNTSGAPITLSNNNTQVWDGNFSFGGTNALNLGTGAVTLDATDTITTTAGTLTIGGAIGDGGDGFGITKAGAGALILDGVGTYSGTTTIDAGVLQLGNADAAEDSAVSIGTADGLTFATSIGNFTIGGLTGASNEALADTGGIAVTLTVGQSGSNNIYSGILSGSGAIVIGAGTEGLSGINTYTGGTTLSSGAQLNIDNAAALGAGTFTIDGGSIDNGSGAAMTLSNNNPETWAGNFTFIGSNALNLGTGAVTLGGSETVTVTANMLTVSGVIGDSASGFRLSLGGSGTLTLSAANTYGGGTTVLSGTLLADNVTGSATGSGNVTVDSGGTLGGTGTISGSVTVNSGGTLAPGNGGTAIFNTGNLTLSAGSNLNIALNGDTVGSQYDQVNVSGTITVTNAILDLSGSRSAHDGSDFTILINGSASPVTGTFSGLAEGGTTTFNGVVYEITYLGGGSDNVDLEALPGSTSTALGSSANPSVDGQSVTFTATVASLESGTPTGSVTFLDGTTTLGVEAVNGSGVATFTTSSLIVGSHDITAVYSGDTNFSTSTSSETTQVVDQDATTSAVGSSVNPSTFGQSVTFTATVTANAPGAGTPTGTVTFLDGVTTLGTEALNSSGTTTFTTSALTVGTHSVTVVYNGDSDFVTSTSSAVSQVVNTDATTSVVVSSANPSVFGQSVTFTATVSSNAPGSGTPTGTVMFLDGVTTLGTQALNGSGSATFATSGLSVGTHSITVVYNGDSNFVTSTSSAVSQVVNQDATTSVVVSSANPSVFGQSVTFTATVTSNVPGSGTPTGTVTFLDGVTTLDTQALNGSGVATFTSSALSVGTHSITVVYNGDSDFVASTSSAVSQVVNKDTTNSVVVSSANPSVSGQSVTFTATVTSNVPGSGTPTGTVTFLDGVTTLATQALNGSGIATFTSSALAVGTHSITVVYNGDSDFVTSTSSALSQVVNTDATTSVVISSANPSVFGQSVTFTATVSSSVPGSGTPTGTVTFLDGVTTLGTQALNGSGSATFATSALTVGTHSITVVYNGDSNFVTSTSSAVSQVVNQDATTSVVVSSANPSVFGQSVTFTATVSSNAPGSGTPTGIVTFLDGVTTLGTQALNGSGSATFATSALSVGTHSITVVYNGDSDFVTSTSSAVSQVVNQDATTSAIVSSANPSLVGQSVTFTDTIAADAPGSGVPTGTVTFEDGSTVLGTDALNGAGIATFTTSALGANSHSITAIYGGDVNFSGSTSNVVTQVVNGDATTSVVVSSANPSVFGESVTFTATVTVNPPGSGTPTGSVTFLDGLTTLGVETLNGSATAAFTTTALIAGTHSITAVYSGDSNFNSSSSAIVSQVVNPDATTSTVVSSVNPSVSGQSVTFTATITANAPGSGTPTGTVTFLDGVTTLGTEALNGSGIATFTSSALSVGTHSITVVYNGDSNFVTSTSSAVSQVVNQDATTSIVVSSANPSVFGQSVTFTATVTANAPGSGTPTGTVTFLDGVTTLGTQALNGSGIATFTSSALSVGIHSITVVYNGDSDFVTSTSSAVSQVVNTDATTSVVISSANPSVFGQSVTFTATVTANAPGSGTPTGTVTFLDGVTTLGTEALNGSGSATFATSALTVGTHSITVVYNGDSNFVTSTSSAVSQVVNTDATTSVVVSSANPSVFGQSVTFTATVSSNAPGSGTPTGTVTFLDGATTLGTQALNGSGIATFTSSALSVGTHSITVVYNGDSNFVTSTSSAVSQVVNKDTTTSVVVSSANPSVFGQSVSFTATVTSNAPGSGTPTGTVTFLDGVTTLGTQALNGSGVATFTSSALSVGTHSITVVYNGDSDFVASTSSAVSQVVNKDTTTSVVVSSVNPSVSGQSVTFTATVTSNVPGSGTPTGTVTFLDGVTTLATQALNGSGIATFTSSALAVGTHSITVVYNGDSDFVTSTSSALSQVVNTDASTSVVVSSANPSVFGQSVTFTATVASNAPGSGTPTGTVTFLDGVTTLGTEALNGSGATTFTTSSLTVGTHSITVVYNGDSDFVTSTSSAVSQVVNQDATTSVVASSANPSVFGQSVTFTATVSSNAPGSGTPAGTVTFLDGVTTLGTQALNGSGSATFVTSALTVGTHSITVVYNGDPDFLTSTSSAVSQVVNKDATASVVVSSANPTVFGQTVTLTDTVAASGPGSGTPTGSVTFMDGGTTLGIGTLNGSGVATFTTTSLAVASHSITADYGSDADFNASTSTALTQVVHAVATTTALTSSVNPSVFEQSVTFTATVTANAPGSGTPAGSVTFKDGATTLATIALNGSGIAAFTTSSLAIGSHSVTAVYGTTTDFATSTSSAVTQVVNRAATTSTLTASVNPSVFGQSVTLTATVTASLPGAGVPAGSVTFKDGTTTLGAATLNGSGIATFSIASLAAASHSITAVYAGNADYTTSTSPVVSQTVNQAVTSATVTSSDNPSDASEPVTFTATITASAPGSGAPGGTVTFKDGATTLAVRALNASGIATFTTSTLALGAHSITVVYSGSASYLGSTSSALTQNVDAAIATQVTVANQPTDITAGQSGGSLVADVTNNSGAVDHGFSGSATVSIVTGPTGATLDGTTTTTVSSGVATFSNLDLTQAGQYVLKVSAGGFTTETAPITISAGPAAKVAVSATPGASWQFGALSPGIVVAVTDKYGNRITTGNINVTASIASGPLGAILSGIQTVQAVNGLAAFTDLSLDLPGAYSLKFTSGDDSPAVIANVEIVAIPVRRYLFNGSSLGSSSILLEQENDAPSMIDLGAPTVIDLPAVVISSAPADVAAATFSDTTIDSAQLFAANNLPEASDPSLFGAAINSLQQFLDGD